jgi:hypothetical protein
MMPKHRMNATPAEDALFWLAVVAGTIALFLAITQRLVGG